MQTNRNTKVQKSVKLEVNKTDSELSGNPKIFFENTKNHPFRQSHDISCCQAWIKDCENVSILQKGYQEALLAARNFANKYSGEEYKIDVIENINIGSSMKIFKNTCDIGIIIKKLNRNQYSFKMSEGIYLFDIVNFRDRGCGMVLSQLCTKEFLLSLSERVLEVRDDGFFNLKTEDRNITPLFMVVDQLYDSCSLMNLTNISPKILMNINDDTFHVKYGMLQALDPLESFEERIENLIFTGKTVRKFNENVIGGHGATGLGQWNDIDTLVKDWKVIIKTTRVHVGGGKWVKVLRD